MYQLVNSPATNTPSEYAKNTEDGSMVHRESNEAYLKWLEEGNTVLPPDEPVND